jgi:hypothetical protein
VVLTVFGHRSGDLTDLRALRRVASFDYPLGHLSLQVGLEDKGGPRLRLTYLFQVPAADVSRCANSFALHLRLEVLVLRIGKDANLNITVGKLRARKNT